MTIPPWLYAGAAGLALAGAFGAGWQVRGWKERADDLAAVQADATLAQADQDQADTAATDFEKDRDDAQAASRERQTEIRTIYRDRPPPTQGLPGDCAAPDDVRRVLERSIGAANARAAGEPGGEVPGAAAPAGDADRP